MKTISVYVSILLFLFTTSYSQNEKKINAADLVITQQEQGALTPQQVLDLLVEKVSKKNVLLAIKEIRDKSKILNEMESSGAISILGAMHNLETGEVEFYK